MPASSSSIRSSAPAPPSRSSSRSPASASPTSCTRFPSGASSSSWPACHQQRPLRRPRRRPERLARHLPHAAVRRRRRRLFFYIVATLYAAELIWRERDTHFSGIHDALPISETTDWLSKLAALCFVQFILLTVAGLCGILMQTIAGYYHYELLQYFKELYIVTFPQVLIFVLFALFVQTVVSNKFIGHGIVIGVFVIVPILYNFGWENTLYLFGNTPAYTYSDMNGYGHFAPALFWSITYWLAISGVLAVISIALARRGSDEAWPARIRLASQRAPRLIPAAAVFFLIAIGSGIWYFYNAHVLNEYLTAKGRRNIQATYERDFKKYENIPQPKIIAVDSNIDIFPERRSFSGNGHFVLQNKTTRPSARSTSPISKQSVSNIHFDRPFHIVSSSPRALYTIYQLETPLAPGDKLDMTFNVGYTSRGFKDGNERPELAYSGTFFDSGYFPTIGYDNKSKSATPAAAAKSISPSRSFCPSAATPPAPSPISSPQLDWINYRTTVSTSDSDSEGKPQIALSPGYLTRDWHANGRHYFTYDMGDVNTLDFFAFISARYDVKRDIYPGVTNPSPSRSTTSPPTTTTSTTWSRPPRPASPTTRRTTAPSSSASTASSSTPATATSPSPSPTPSPSLKASASSAASKSPRHRLHLLRHRARARPSVVGPSAHRSTVEGSNMLSESLAEYSALMVMQKKYGRDSMHRFLKHELDGYLRGRAGEIRKERPVVYVQNEPYVWYQKGGQVIYTLADYIGEDKVNLALHNFLMQYRYANATDNQSGPYPDTRQFVDALRAQTPPDLQYYITDAFENIVLYDNKALTATVTPTPDNKYKVTLTVQASKLKSDGSGNESPLPLNDLHRHRRLQRQKGPRKTPLPTKSPPDQTHPNLRNRSRPNTHPRRHRPLQQTHRPRRRRQPNGRRKALEPISSMLP